jgi:hypothetical protein
MHKNIIKLVQRIIEIKVNFFFILKLKFLHVIEVEHFSYPYVNLYYACIKSDQAIGPEI